MTHSHAIQVHNFDLVDGHGSTMMHVGEAGFNAGETETLNPAADFEPPRSGDIDYFNDHEFQSEFDKANLGALANERAFTDSDSGGWLDSFGDSFSDGDSSSSSCSSCGGGCGGD